MIDINQINSRLRKVPTWPLYVIGALPPFWYFYLGLTGGLGVDPTKEMEHRLGFLAIKLLIATLAVTPLRRYVGLNLLKFRRALGLIAFYLVSMHLLTWLVLDVQIPTQILGDIAKRPYITIGMAAFVLMIPLAITSTNGWIRRLGARWRSLHKLVYPAAILGAVHYTMLTKAWEAKPLTYLAIVLAVLALRLPVKRWLAARRALA